MKLIGPPSTELLQFLTEYVTTLWPWLWPLTLGVTWCHLGGQWLCELWDVYDLPFQSYDDYNFPLTAILKSQFLSFF